MERKLIKLANKTLVVSLPYQWVERMKLKKGNSVEIRDRGKELVLSFPKEKGKRKIELDLRNYNERLARRAFSAAYKTGFDELVLKTSDDGMESFIGNFIGVVVSEKNKDSIRVRNLLDSESADFDQIFKKVFFMIDSFAADSLIAIRKKDRKEMSDLMMRRGNFAKHLNLCSHILNSKGKETIRETNTYFYVVSILDFISDLYFRILSTSLHENSRMNRSFPFFSKVNNLLHSAYDLYFNNADLNKIYDAREEIFAGQTRNSLCQVLLSVIAKAILELTECKIMLDLARSPVSNLA
jgi:phosphate uptake regulator